MREEIGFIPWYFNIPETAGEAAWAQLFDREGFLAEYGPTTLERRSERFMAPYDHSCLWNGPSWPYATSQTLTAMANLLNNYSQTTVTKSDFLRLLRTYARSHYITDENKKTVPWIDENLDPDTGEWARPRLCGKMQRSAARDVLQPLLILRHCHLGARRYPSVARVGSL